MLIFLLKRLFQAIIVMLIVSFIVVLIQDNLGDPLRELVGVSVSEAQREILREEMGLNDPFLVKYGRFLGGAIHGDFGTSYFYGQPVFKVIFEKLPATLDLVIGATLIIVLISIPAGIYCALKPQNFITRLIMGLSTLGISIPVFLTGILLIYVFAINGNMPSYGRGEIGTVFGISSGFFSVDGLVHLVMPCVALSSIMLPLFIRLVRSEMLNALNSEYAKFAKAKGLKNRDIYYKHALKNALLPVVTMGGVQIGMLIAYTILTETVFQWPGSGRLFIDAIHRTDTPLITGYVIFVAALFVIINSIVDILYVLINPTVSLSNAGDK